MLRTLSDAEGREALAAGLEYLSPFMVGFAKITVRDGEQNAEIGGSGTLVQANGRYGILTADHVITNLPDRGDVGLILATGSQIKLQRPVLCMDHAEKVRLAPASKTEHGPDLGLILLPESVAKRLEVNNMFYNLAKRRDAALAAAIPSDNGGWVVSGMIDEWTFELPDERGMRVKGFKGFVGGGVANVERRTAEFDYMEFESRVGQRYEGPDSYGGISGGGLWQLSVCEENGKIMVRDAVLFGVVFYQKVVAGGIDLICHGRRSVYECALRELQGKNVARG